MLKTIKGTLDCTTTTVVAASSTTVNTTTDNITAASHGLRTGQIVDAITASSLPTGLAVNTQYFVIAVDKDTIALATSLANAQAGTKIDLTGAGAGNLTLRNNAFGAVEIGAEQIPNGAFIVDCWTETVTDLTSGGSATVALSASGATIKAATAFSDECFDNISTHYSGTGSPVYLHMPLVLSNIADGDLITTFTPGFAGRIVKSDFVKVFFIIHLVIFS